MHKFWFRALGVAVFTGSAFAQLGGLVKPTGTVNGEPFKPEKPMSFEVATVKPADDIQKQAMSGKMHVGLNVDGARADIGGLSMTDLIGMAYKVKMHQISGPDWMKIDRFDIMGKMPEGAKQDDIPALLQSLLADRFGLKFHLETRDHPVYALEVAKGGPKLKESPPDEVPPPDGVDKPKEKEEKGVTTMNVGGQKMEVKQSGEGNATMSMKGGVNGNMKMTMENGHMHMELSKVNMAALSEVLSRFVDKPVMDQTELTGNYQVALDLTMEDLMNVARQQGMQIPGGAPGGAATSSRPADTIADPAGSSLFTTVAAMGLKLESKKLPIPVLVIDHVEKTPTEN